MVLDVPEKIRQEDRERHRTADPEPVSGERAALRSQEQAEDETSAEDQHRVFVFDANARQHAKRDPQLLVTGLDDTDEQVRASEPEQRLQWRHREEIDAGENPRGNQDREGGETPRKPVSPEVASGQGG